MLLNPLALLIACVLLAPAAAGEPDGRDRPAPRLTLVWYDAYRLLPHGFDLMRREVASVFDRLAVRIDWKQGGAGRIPGSGGDSADPGEILVVLLPSEPAGWGLDGDVMGAVMGQEVPRRAVYLFFPAVARTLGYRPKQQPILEPKWIRDLGRSLGRVVAHELVHALAPEQPHAADGLMSCQLKRTHLLAPRVTLDPESASVFVAGLGRALGDVTERAVVAGTPGRREGEGILARLRLKTTRQSLASTVNGR